MARSPILKEMGTPVNGHEGQEVILQNLLVTFTIHRDILQKEEKAPTSHSPRKTGPDHHTIRVFDGFDRVA
jgi:hypothetical protein